MRKGNGKMRKILAVLLIEAVMLSFAACDGNVPAIKTQENPASQSEQAVRSDEGDEKTAISPENTADVEIAPVSNEDVAEAAAETEAPTEAPTEAENEPRADGIRPEFKEAMDSYEAFYTEYCEFMKSYSENPTDLTLLAQYADMLAKADEMNEAFEAWDEDDLNSEELKYYLDVNNRVMQMLVDVAG